MRLRRFAGTALGLLLVTGAVFAARLVPDAVIVFEKGTDRTLPADTPALEQLAAAAKSSPANWIRLEGFAGGQGSRELNLALAQRRIEDIGSRLAALGFPAHRILGTNYGDETIEETGLPIRRVEIRIEKMGR